MISIGYAKMYCKDYEKIENYEIALSDKENKWCCHHRLETHNSDGEKRKVFLSAEELIALDMYYDRPPEELIFLSVKEHNILHNTKERNPMFGKQHSKETKQKMKEAHKTRVISLETRKKHSKCTKGKHWYTNGVEDKFSFECPNGFYLGRTNTKKSSS